MTTKNLTTKTIVKGRDGTFEIAPEFPQHAVYFHPIAKKFQKACRKGIHVFGFFGRTHDTGKKDARGKRIFVRYFIPLKFSI